MGSKQEALAFPGTQIKVRVLNIFTSSGKFQKLVDQFTHLGSNISSTKGLGLLLTGYQSQRNLITLIKSNDISSKLGLCQY